MARKTISLDEDAHEQLVKLKREDESFSDVIRRLAEVSRGPMDSAGSYPGLGDAVDSAREEFEEGGRKRVHQQTDERSAEDVAARLERKRDR